MRLATLDDGTPDGRLVAVEGDACRPVACGTMLAWLAGGDASLGAPEPMGRAMACLPRAWGFLDGSAYVNHVALVRRARGAEMPERFWREPLMYQGHAVFDAPDAPIPAGEGWGTDLEAEVAVLLGPVARGASRAEAMGAIRAVCLLNDVSLRGMIPDELAKGFGFVQSKPASALSPMAVTPDALDWGGRLRATVHAEVNGRTLGRTEAGEDMTFDFPALVAHAAATRNLPAGTVIGSGTVSNRGADGGPGATVDAGGRGYSCLAEQRMVETIRDGRAATPWLRPGDRVRIWAEAGGRDLFGAIEQEVVAA